MGHGKRHPFIPDLPHGRHEGGQDHGARRADDRRCWGLRVPEPLRHPLRAGRSTRPLPRGQSQRLRSAVATNNMYTSAFRGFGALQACAAYEQQMDEIAETLDIDRLELRRRNFLKTGEPMSTGFVPPSAIWTEQCAEKAWAALGEPTPAEGPIRTGRGLACYQQSYGRLTFLHDTSEAWVGVEMDGTVVVRSGVTDIGAGQISALGQIAVEVLGVTLDNVVIYNSDSAVTPLAGTTTATRALYMTGNAAKQAAEGLRARLAERAAQEFGVALDEIDMGFNEVFIIDKPEASMPLVDLVRICAAEGHPPLRARNLPRAVRQISRPRDGPGSGPSRLCLRRACRRGVGRRGDRRSRSTEERRRPRCRPVHQPGGGRGPDPGWRADGQGYALSEEMPLRGGPPGHTVVQRVPHADGDGYARRSSASSSNPAAAWGPSAQRASASRP